MIAGEGEGIECLTNPDKIRAIYGYGISTPDVLWVKLASVYQLIVS
jgi:hypothetical protein